MSSNSELIENANNLGMLNYFPKPTRIKNLLNLAHQLIFGINGAMQV